MNRRAACTALVLAACAAGLALRAPQLDLRPMHTDEAVHTVKCATLWQTGQYTYDPHEYHGPTLYYATLPVRWLLGGPTYAQSTAVMYRVVPVVFGVVSIALLLLLVDGLGRWAVAWAGLLMAISPALTFYGRYYIQETLLLCFAVLVMGAGWRFVQSRRIGWALLAGIGIGLMHATKETCIIVWAAMLGAIVATRYWPVGGQRRPQWRFTRRDVIVLLFATVAAGTVSTALLSGLFTNPRGPLDAILTYISYAHRAVGAEGAHVHPPFYYMRLMLWPQSEPGPKWSDVLVLALSLVGAVAAIRGRVGGIASVRFVRFVGVYALLLLVMYSAIPYKTPWCVVGPLHGLILLAGVGAASIVEAGRHVAWRVPAVVVLLAACTQLTQQSIRANYVFHSDRRNPYAYGFTVLGAERLAAEVDRIADVHPAGRSMLIRVIADNPWPLPWYLRSYERVGYWEDVPDQVDAEIVFASHTHADAVADRLQGDYHAHFHGLRVDEVLTTFIRQELWDRYIATRTTTRPVAP